MADKIQQLQNAGVMIPCPHQVWIDDSVDVSRIESGTVLHPGTRIEGEDTSIGPDCQLGGETPVTIKSCQLGRGVELQGGFHHGAVYWDQASVGSSAHIRPGTILEEEACCAHGVGLKQTIFFPFMVSGSLINFCDALMAGGTSRSHHSEIGSGYIHFNFTPRGDKATPSLVGDVVKGVLLNQNPIFLGGQGGLIGPAKIAYGTTLAAGVMQRGDVLEEHQLVLGSDPLPSSSRSFDSRLYGNVKRTLLRNLEYMGNIQALRMWYQTVRAAFVGATWQQAVLDGGRKNLDLIYQERLKRLADMSRRLERSASLLKGESRGKEQECWTLRWPAIEDQLDHARGCEGDRSLKERVCSIFANPTEPYLETIQHLSIEDRDLIQTWLESVVDPFILLQRTGDDS